MKIPKLTVQEVMIYETNASWWAGYVSWPWLQQLVGRYYANKARRKYARLEHARKWQAALELLRNEGIVPAPLNS